MKRYFIEADGHIIEVNFEKWIHYATATYGKCNSFTETIKDLIEWNQNTGATIGFEWIETSMESPFYHPDWETVRCYWEEDF